MSWPPNTVGHSHYYRRPSVSVSMAVTRSRNWQFTLNNYTEDDISLCRAVECKYIVFGKEVAPTTGTPHLQGLVVFGNAKTQDQVRKVVKGHITLCDGKVAAMAAYCKKGGEWEEHGTAPLSQQKKGEKEKERWDRARQLAVEGKVEEVDSDIYMRYYSTLKKIAVDHLITPPDLETLENRWICGPSGCGKSRGVRAEYPGAYNKDPKTRWWDGYVGQETVVIDDLDVYDKAIGGDLKRWVDHYPFPAQMKGSSVSIRPKRVIVTSQYTPEEIWEDPKTLEALNRRFRIENQYGAPSPCVAFFKPPK
nr:MAG: hypothetical protein [Chemarfal virus 283]